jgi:hypothetical protein
VTLGLHAHTLREPPRVGTQGIIRPSSVTLSSFLVHIPGLFSVHCGGPPGCRCEDSPFLPLKSDQTPLPYLTQHRAGLTMVGSLILCQRTNGPDTQLDTEPQSIRTSPLSITQTVGYLHTYTCVHTHLHTPQHWGLTWENCSAQDPAEVQAPNTCMDSGPPRAQC